MVLELLLSASMVLRIYMSYNNIGMLRRTVMTDIFNGWVGVLSCASCKTGYAVCNCWQAKLLPDTCLFTFSLETFLQKIEEVLEFTDVVYRDGAVRGINWQHLNKLCQLRIKEVSCCLWKILERCTNIRQQNFKCVTVAETYKLLVWNVSIVLFKRVGLCDATWLRRRGDMWCWHTLADYGFL